MNDSVKTLEQIFQSALQYQQAGQVNEAERAYRTVLDAVPQYPPALHFLGLLLSEKGDRVAGVPLLKQSLQLDPSIPEFHNNLGVVLEESGEKTAAESCYRDAVRLRSNYVEALNNLGNVLLGRGELEEAEPHYQAALRFQPAYIKASMGLAGVHEARSKWDGAESIYRQILSARPSYFPALSGLSRVLAAQGKHGEAEKHLLQAITMDHAKSDLHLDLARLYLNMEREEEAQGELEEIVGKFPECHEAHEMLAQIAIRDGRLNQAEIHLCHALESWPHPHSLNQLGQIYMETGERERAKHSFQEALALDRNYYEGYISLGYLLIGEKSYGDGIDIARQAIANNSERFEAWRMLGDVLKLKAEYYLKVVLIQLPKKYVGQEVAQALREEQQRVRQKAVSLYEESEQSYRAALSRAPGSYETLVNLSLLLHQSLGRHEEAEGYLLRAVEFYPDRALAPFNLGFLLLPSRQDEALGWFERAMRSEPRNEEIYLGVGAALRAHGLVAELIAFLEEALEKDTLNHRLHSYLIWNLDSTPWVKLKRQQGERKHWDALQVKGRGIVPNGVFSNTKDMERRLRIGLFSGEFYDNSAPNGFGPFLLHHDRRHFEVICYSNSPRHDAMTERLKEAAAGWRDINRLSDDEAAALVQEDGIDLLIDNSGHSYSTNRLLMFARKPAPIQITAWGYPSGTGLEAMDYLFQDDISVPPEECALYAEKVVYLPCVISYLSRDDAPSVSPLPALTNGCVTYGCFNAPHKISDDVLAIWAELLLTQPGARLILKYSGMDEALQKKRILTPFVEKGVNVERITILGGSSWYRHLEMYQHVDIALDAFPYGGGVTTLDALWMGVPVVGFRWDFIGGRNSASILTAAGLADWVTESPQEYLQMALERSRDLARLADLRAHLREQLRKSRLANPDIYVRRVEEILRDLWREWCGKT
ncbi:MAG: tetratricopeptide repeat protein [Sulfuricella sp.]